MKLSRTRDVTLPRDVISGFHPEGCDTVKSMVDHEMGHQIENFIPSIATHEITHMFNELGYNEKKTGLSTYSTNNVSEFIAEAWAEYQNNPSPRTIAKQVANILLRYKK